MGYKKGKNHFALWSFRSFTFDFLNAHNGKQAVRFFRRCRGMDGRPTEKSKKESLT